MNRTLINILQKMISDHPKDWDLLLQKALMHYRSTVHSSTGFTPYRLMFGREMNLPVDIALNLPSEDSKATVPEFVSKQAEIINETETLAREHLETAQNRQKKHYDIKKAGVPYKKGDLALLLVKAVPTGQPRKFHKEYIGPWKIVTVLSDLDYTIQFIGTKNNGPVKRRKVRKIVHFNQLKLFYGDIETEQGKGPVQGEKDAAEGLERELEQTNEDRAVVIEDSDSESVSEDIINNDEDDSNGNFNSETDLSAQRPPSPIQQRVEDRTRAQRPGSVRRLQRLDDNSENDGRDQPRPERDQILEIDRRAQRPPDQMHQGGTRAHRPGLDRAIQRQRDLPEGDGSAQRPPERENNPVEVNEEGLNENVQHDESRVQGQEELQARPRRNVRLPAHFRDFVMIRE